MDSNTNSRKPIIGVILGCILIISFVIGIVDANLKNENLKIITRGCLLVFSIIYTYANFSRYQKAKQSDQS